LPMAGKRLSLGVAVIISRSGRKKTTPMDEASIIDGLKTVCQCRGIRKRRFLDHIAAGHTTLAALQRVTGAGAGDCGGKRCTPRIKALLAAKGGGA
jgi:NAD(P)H-nitrite reductase large subunit